MEEFCIPMQKLHIFNYRINNQSGTTLEVAIDGDIVDASTQKVYEDWWGDDTSTSFKSFRDEVKNAVANGVTDIVCSINSLGGYVTEAMAIHDFMVQLQNNGTKVNCIGTGIVASAATYILMASRNASMTENSFFMIHNVSGYAYGDVNQVENQAKTLRKFNDTIRDFYANATGLPKETISGMMNKESWLTASEAKEKGFINAVTGAVEFTNKINPEQWQFNNMAILNSYNQSINSSQPSDMKKLQEAIENGFANLMEKLGINAAKQTEQKEAIEAFSNSIVDAVKDAIPTQEAITDMVNAAMGNSLETMKTGIIEDVTKAANTANEAFTKDVNDLKEELKEAKDAFANKSGGEAGGQAGNGGNKMEGISWT